MKQYKFEMNGEEYSPSQISYLAYEVSRGRDISLISNRKYCVSQMRLIMKLDIKYGDLYMDYILNKPYSPEQCEMIERAFNSSTYPEVIMKPELSPEQMKAIICGVIFNHLTPEEASIIANPKYSVDHIRFLACGMSLGKDISSVLDPAIPIDELKIKLKALPGKMLRGPKYTSMDESISGITKDGEIIPSGLRPKFSLKDDLENMKVLHDCDGHIDLESESMDFIGDTVGSSRALLNLRKEGEKPEPIKDFDTFCKERDDKNE